MPPGAVGAICNIADDRAAGLGDARDACESSSIIIHLHFPNDASPMLRAFYRPTASSV